MAEWLIYLLCGCAGGVLTGMGLGGGAVLVLLLTSFADAGQVQAQSAAALCFVVSGAFAMPAHFKSGSIDKKAALTLVLWGVPLAVAGALAANAVQPDTLRRLFGWAAVALAFLPQKGRAGGSNRR